MNKQNFLKFINTLILLMMITSNSYGQKEVSQTASWASTLFKNYQVKPDINYLTVNGWKGELDLYLPTTSVSPTPTVLYFHGGGWHTGDKDEPILRLLPYFEMGWAIVNVEYRLASVSLAPAAVEDCRYALSWIVDNATTYNLDTNKIVVSGHSAGGHLALTTAMLTPSAGLDPHCSGEKNLKVAAVINWYGITDVEDLIEGENTQQYALNWIGDQPNKKGLAQKVSPLSYIRPNLPPILTIHGDSDSLVPYEHAVRLHHALTKAGVPNKLITILNGPHGPFSRVETKLAHEAITEFLEQHGLTRLSGGNF